MIIDFHVHAYIDSIAPKACKAVPKGSPYGPYYDCTVGGLVRKMYQAGVDKAVMLSIANNPSTTVKVNDFAIASISERIIPFGSVHPLFVGYRDEIRRLKSAGIKGIKFHPYYQKYDLADKSVYPVYEACAEEDMIMLFHGGLDLMVPGDNSTPSKMRDIADALPGAKIVAAHLGGWNLWEECFRYLIGRDIYIDTSFAFSFIDDKIKRRVIDNHDNNKILFGTDSPWSDMTAEVTDMQRFLIDTDLRERIMYKNAAKLLDVGDS